MTLRIHLKKKKQWRAYLCFYPSEKIFLEISKSKMIMAMVFISKRFNRQFKPPKFQFFFTYCGQGYGYGKKDFALRPNKLKKGNRLSCKKRCCVDRY